ncbi:MAG TPA: hypothetical protein VGA46_06440 [Methyloceanibacter sp.]|jgi:hypothetical protein
MKKYLLAATLICAFAVPVVAADSFYIVFDKTTKTCSMARSAPTDTEKFSMMGIYGSEADAHMAMAGMTKCKR